MKISKIKVENFRSINSAEIDLTRFSIFVGQNNHGKTNFFEAIEWFYNAKSTPKDCYLNLDEKNTITVELTFDEVVESDIEKLTNEATKTKIRNILGESKTFKSRKLVLIIRESIL